MRTESDRSDGMEPVTVFTPEGTPVILTDDLGERWNTRTRSAVWTPGQDALVKVDGIAGGYLVERMRLGHEPGLPHFADRKVRARRALDDREAGGVARRCGLPRTAPPGVFADAWGEGWDAPGGASRPIPPNLWGRDHWTTIAYAFTCLGRAGHMDRARMRVEGNPHATRLHGGEQVPGHDDLDVLDDAAAAGVLELTGTGMHPSVQFTAAGLVLGQWLCKEMTLGRVRTAELTWDHALAESGARPTAREVVRA